MTDTATGTFELASWDENTYTETDDGTKLLTRASVGQKFSGDIDGDGAVEWLMCYRPDETADFVGLQRIVGSIGGRTGSVVMTTIGTFDGKEARGALVTVPGSGTGDLAGIDGSGEFRAPMGGTPTYSLEYTV